MGLLLGATGLFTFDAQFWAKSKKASGKSWRALAGLAQGAAYPVRNGTFSQHM